MTNYTNEDQSPVFYFFGINSAHGMSLNLPLIPDKLRNRQTFIIIPPDRVYRLEKRFDKDGNECMVLRPCKDVIAAMPIPYISNPERFLNYSKEQQQDI